ncbi:hypothetical protein MACJ_001184 [Theileria orientalis]|uniref:Uncharacterized protein n=1 Tax=Theileria orientalis TaxID=68886 RepID=A0A976M7Z0_THEOR|nr:hypothetical protein MACJ_001184 [Theileria orientalis]
MGSSYNSFDISELERTESLWLCHKDSLDNIISTRSKQSSVNDLNEINNGNVETKSQDHNHVDKNFENKRQTINLLDFKSILKLKGIVDKTFIPQPDAVAPLNDEQLDDTDYLSETTTSSSDFDENDLPPDESDGETSEPVNLKDLMIYQTIRFMDYRRFSRRFNGIRKPVSNKKALVICLFCSVLALVPFVVFRKFEQYYVVSIQVKRGAMAYVSSLAFLGAAFLLAKIQLSLPLRLPVILSYMFMFITLIVLIVVRNIAKIDKYVWPLLISYASVQIFLISLTKAFIYFVPILALHGQFFPCTEHFNLLKRSITKRKLNITISRYNDYTSIWETRSCGFFMCIYRTLYRLVMYIKKKMNERKDISKRRDTPLFGHQMRYYGKVDHNNLPHGYGEWLEDHIYGERLHGYWWHGYPVGPFKSQEIGSGSIFVNNRVAFMTGTHLEKGKRRYGVSSTECSISGYFFRQMPRTYFFNPEYRNLKEASNRDKRDVFFLLQRSFENIMGSSLQWCVGMLKRQFHLNKPSDESHMSIYVDKLTDSLKIEGHRVRPGERSNHTPDELVIKLVKYKGKSKSMPPLTRNIQPKTSELPLYKVFTTRLIPHKQNDTSEGKGNEQIKSKISMLIRDEDEWENKQQMFNHKIVANGWCRVRPSMKNDLVSETVVLYIHGYNTTLSEACSQMAHIVSFAKLPPYILPIVFNWKGHSWGVFSAFSYPKAVKRCNNPNIVEAFNLLINDLIKLGIKNVHFLIHSCGARIFFNVISSAIRNGLIMPVLSDEFLVVNPQVQNERLRMDSAILINPDYSLEKFRTEEYFMLRGYCDHIVMYVNNRDNCLWVSEFYNRERSLGKCIFEMRTSPSILSKVMKKDCPEEPFTMYDGRESSETGKKTKFQNSYSMDEVSNDNYGSMEGESAGMHVDMESESQRFESEGENKGPKETKLMIDVNEDKQDRRSTLHKIFRSRPSLNKYRKTKHIFWSSRSDSGPQSYENKNLWLDMDVIDTSMIDTNVDFLKHSFYQVKREIMDDIREVILLHTRADHRQSRLDRRRGNVIWNHCINKCFTYIIANEQAFRTTEKECGIFRSNKAEMGAGAAELHSHAALEAVPGGTVHEQELLRIRQHLGSIGLVWVLAMVLKTARYVGRPHDSLDPPPLERLDRYWLNSPKFRILSAYYNSGKRPAAKIALMTYEVRYFNRGLDHPFTMNEVKDFLFKMKENYLIENHPGVQYPNVFRQHSNVKTPATLTVNLH